MSTWLKFTPTSRDPNIKILDVCVEMTHMTRALASERTDPETGDVEKSTLFLFETNQSFISLRVVCENPAKLLTDVLAGTVTVLKVGQNDITKIELSDEIEWLNTVDPRKEP